MADQEQDFKIKGAASAKSSSSSSPPPVSTASDTDRPADDDVKNKTPVDKAEEGDTSARKRKADEIELSQQELKDKYKWFKAPAPIDKYGPNVFFYGHADTRVTQWEEPDEFLVYNEATDEVRLEESRAVKKKRLGIREDWMGYIPAIDGSYDRNAWYAAFHNQMHAEETAATQATATTQVMPTYDQSMAQNRFTGHAQRAGLGPERHSDAAKASRQVNAYFDSDAWANSHDGRSLKEERRNIKYSGKQIKAFQKKKAESKRRKILAKYGS